MRVYPAATINVGQWRFYPQLMIAQNWHNGALAEFHQTDTGWQVVCGGCPAPWMLKDLAEWFGKWITGTLAAAVQPVTEG